MGSRTRLETNPGESFTTTGVLCNASTISTTFTTVSSAVSRPRITSTSGITGTGFMKCIPITWAARLVCAAIVELEIDGVLLASTAAGGAKRPTSRQTVQLGSDALG